MYRISHILTITLFCLTLSAAAWAQDPQEDVYVHVKSDQAIAAEMEVRKFVEDHIKSYFTDTPEQILEHYIPPS